MPAWETGCAGLGAPRLARGWRKQGAHLMRGGPELEIMSDEKPKILYIAGWDRSGSTILDNILGQIEGFRSVGEFRDVWSEYHRAAQGEYILCGCGARLEQCEFWNGVLTEAFGALPAREDWDRWYALSRSVERLRYTPVVASAWGRRLMRRRIAALGQVMAKLYRAVHARGSVRVIIDSSKTASHARLLLDAAGYELYVVHLVRDPRACAYSWLRRKAHPGGPGGLMGRMGVARSTLMCVATHLGIEWALRGGPARYLRVRYEDFAERPRETVERILELVGETGAAPPFVSDNLVELKPLHCVSGNPNRFQRGTVLLGKDEEWRTKMGSLAKWTATLLALPILWRYGYEPAPLAVLKALRTGP